MKNIQFAIESIVDANSRYAFPHKNAKNAKIDYRAAEQHSRLIRSQSVASWFGSIKPALADAFSRFKARMEEKKNLQKLFDLDDHHLQDIGLTRNQLFEVKDGAMTLRQLHQLQANKRSAWIQSVPATLIRQDDGKNRTTAANEDHFACAECA